MSFLHMCLWIHSRLETNPSLAAYYIFALTYAMISMLNGLDCVCVNFLLWCQQFPILRLSIHLVMVWWPSLNSNNFHINTVFGSRSIIFAFAVVYSTSLTVVVHIEAYVIPTKMNSKSFVLMQNSKQSPAKPIKLKSFVIDRFQFGFCSILTFIMYFMPCSLYIKSPQKNVFVGSVVNMINIWSN